MDRMKGKIASAFDGLRNNLQSSAGRQEMLEMRDRLTQADFKLSKVVRHGFPHNAKCVAYDAVQRLLAIGTAGGSIRVFGQPGVDVHLRHESDSGVSHLAFLVNEGALISVCKNDCIHLWNFRQKRPEIVHSLQFQKESITSICLPFQSKWLYVGTEKGNVFTVSIANFSVSGYVIYWNKAIDISQKTHPGQVNFLSECPTDENKLLIGFDKGTVVLWDLKQMDAEARFQCEQAVRGLCWHFDGKQFVCAQADGRLTVWNPRRPTEPVQSWAPHGRAALNCRQPQPASTEPKERCRPITQIEWKYGNKGDDEFLIFSGGLPLGEGGVLPAITVLRGGKSATVLEMEHNIVQFLTLCASPYPNDTQEPFAVAVLLKKDFLIVDLTSNGYPCFENPYPMDLHESPVTCCSYVANCPNDLIGAFHSVGSKQKTQGYSEKAWPITGGEWGSSASSNPELIITGHEDGTLKFWDASSENLHLLYRLKTGRHFERPSSAGRDETPLTDKAGAINHFSVTHIALCVHSRVLVVAGAAAQVTVFRFIKTECASEIPVVDVPLAFCGDAAPEKACKSLKSNDSNSSTADLKRQGSVSSHSSAEDGDDGGGDNDGYAPLKVRGGQMKRPAGYQPEVVCITIWRSAAQPERVTALAFNTAYGILAYGNECGVAVVDVVQHVAVLVMNSADLYGANDPFTRPSAAVYRPQASDAGASSSAQPPPSFTAGPNGGDRPAGSERRQAMVPSGGRRRSSSSYTFEGLPTDDALHAMFKRCSASSSSPPSPVIGVDVADHHAAAASRVECRTQSDSAPSAAALPPIGVVVAPSSPAIQRVQSAPARRSRNATAALRKPQLQVLLSAKETDDDDDSDAAFTDDDGVVVTSFSNRTTTGFISAREAPPPVAGCSVDGSAGSKAAYPRSVDLIRRVQSMNVTVGGAPNKKSLKDIVRRISTHKNLQLPIRRRFSMMNYLCSPTERSGGGGKQRNGGGGVSSPSVTLKSSAASASRLSDSSRTRSQEGSSKDTAQLTAAASRSSSCSSLDAAGAAAVDHETVTSLAFIQSPARKNDTTESPSLWVGTSFGSCVVLNLLIPTESRLEQQVYATPTGSVFRCKGRLLQTAFFDARFSLLGAAAESFKDKTDGGNPLQNRLVTRGGRLSPGESEEKGDDASPDQQYVLLVGERQAKIVALPSHSTVFSLKFDHHPLMKATTTSMLNGGGGSPFVAALTTAGRVVVYSLPALRPLLDVALLESVDVKSAQSVQFSEDGKGLYMVTESELQKFTLSAAAAHGLADVLGELFLGCDMPEPPKPSFLKGLFTNNQQQTLDREELFGQNTTSKSTAKYIPGPSSTLDPVRAQGNSAGSAVLAAKMALTERGDKLGAVEDKTAHMHESAKAYANNASDLMKKYRNKKWYDFS